MNYIITFSHESGRRSVRTFSGDSHSEAIEEFEDWAAMSDEILEFEDIRPCDRGES